MLHLSLDNPTPAWSLTTSPPEDTYAVILVDGRLVGLRRALLTATELRALLHLPADQAVYVRPPGGEPEPFEDDAFEVAVPILRFHTAPRATEP